MPAPINDWPYLQRLWQRCTTPAAPAAQDLREQHHGELKALYRRGISLEDALVFLVQQRPSLEGYQQWLAARTRELPVPDDSEQAQLLSREELQFWEQHGYLVLRGAVPRAQCEAAQQAIWNYLGASADQPDSWHQEHPGKRGMMLQFSDHPALAANRHGARIRSAYEQLYGTRAIFASIDKVSFNPPVIDGHGFLGSALHWDVSLQPPIPFKLQACCTCPTAQPPMALFIAYPASSTATQHGWRRCHPGRIRATWPARRSSRWPLKARPATSLSGTRRCPIARPPTTAPRRVWCST